MKKILAIILTSILLLATIYYTFIYFATFSEGERSGELIKFSRKGILFKTWEGEISQGISGAQIFKFSVEDKQKKAIENLKKLQGRYVKLTYFERFNKIVWLGDSKYFINKVEEETSPHFNQIENKTIGK
ncbi:6-phosphogluconate dehydrogenase [Tenacibaculum sp. SZ-18]|uniref:6-phosphogluconate dehydrogenase n=1 Tax=Tenacibaculum sp. SZ-18 TaxID=754423 RepID=UPI000C2D6057|nr:6-phosphogluconate dehydrogenase [Tenacibaculum sp. SZ-18]AUC14668.1 6-phosphogluconate dehydrogenase [Tenacibaculum sp. SZ-18]